MSPAVPLLIVISAPSGGGKTTLCDQLLATRSDIVRAVTCTTRPARPGESNGIHYQFLELAAFRARIQAGDFLEHASVYGNLYGTTKAEVLAKLASGRHVLLNMDVQGARSVRAAASLDPCLRDRTLFVFLAPQSLGELERRLLKRGSETPENLAVRLKNATAELAEWAKFDYLLVSTSIAEDLRRMEVIIEAELMRPARSTAPWL